ncbi:hydratase [Tropicibacter sp. S64]|uniref:hydratase n=1 Tax=Tropicibacter sp. S64 TaxID=3415122 RepID=UPI003C79C741
MTSLADTLTNALLQARDSGTRADVSALVLPSYAEALAVQTNVTAQLGPVAGFKVGPLFPGEPMIAPIPQRRVYASGEEVPARGRLGIELEVAFELIRPRAPGMMDTPQDFFRPRVVLELVDTRLDGDAPDPLFKLMDMQLNDGLVVGPALEDWDGSDFGTLTASQRCGDHVIDGALDVPGGSALANLALFVEHVGDHCGGLQPGQIVITGSLTGCTYHPTGTDVTGTIEGLGTISCRIMAA